ncbi:hypothetical protein [Ochrobactrum sp. MYb379]|uniref:hypothetical protein n=1 Tax=Ochrobactrum sp. MYb379 TaxID=2745275 RepID=UPI0030A56467
MFNGIFAGVGGPFAVKNRPTQNGKPDIQNGRGPTYPNQQINGRPIEFDGKYYSADGFKFSDRYYTYLYNNGRPAPFLQAREIMNSNPVVTPDPQGAAGFFRYEGAGLEMIYNPSTKQVVHIQPIR